MIILCFWGLFCPIDFVIVDMHAPLSLLFSCPMLILSNNTYPIQAAEQALMKYIAHLQQVPPHIVLLVLNSTQSGLR